MTYDSHQEATGCTNELYYRSSQISEPLTRTDADYVRETIKRYLEEAFMAGQRSAVTNGERK